MSTYNELKADIKCWERMFERQHKRKPTKHDIRDAAPEIQKCYKDYSAIKKKQAHLDSLGHDVFGSELNKPKVVVSVEEEKSNVFVPVTPNLRKKIEIKVKNKDFSVEHIQEDTFIETLGFDTSVSFSNTDSPKLSLKTSNVFSKKSAAVLKNIENSCTRTPPVEQSDTTADHTDVATENIVDFSSNKENSTDFDVFELTEDSSNHSRTKINDFTKSVDCSDNPCLNFEDNPKSAHSDGTSLMHPTNTLEINDKLLNQEPVKHVHKKRKVEASQKEEGNFVRLNMKSKKYRRPGKSMTGEAYKRQQWKSRGLFGKGPPKDFKNPNKKPPNPKFSKNAKPGKCFKCGEEGHWANKCTGKVTPVVTELTEEEKAAREELDFSSLEPMIRIGERNITNNDDQFQSGDIAVCKPVLDGSESQEYVDELLREGLEDLGYSNFRYGQKEAVIRVLQGKSTLLVLSTGSGKSLVYQLAAYIYFKQRDAITLVISPLISLMDDQIQSLPAKLPGKCVHSHMNKKQKQALKEDIINNKIPLLLISPEGLVAGNYGSIPPIHKMPPISFVCIDEAHCLSSWSDNFRPAYLRVCDMLRLKYRVQCFLALTATCTTASSETVCKFIGVDSEEGVLKGAVIRDNLYLTASFDNDKDRALISLINGDRFKDLGSIIVYCTRREQCERVATLLRTSLPHWAPEEQELCNKKGKRKRKVLDNSTAESYHAGLTPSMRSRVQYHFMCGTLRIVCATVAFGMGLDKANVRSVIHYSMPKSFENYVQEIGRAGRDGRPAHCHVFVDERGSDLAELSRHAHANVVDRYSIRQLLGYIFKPCACATLSTIEKKELKPTTTERTEDSTEHKEGDHGDQVDAELDAMLADDTVNWDVVDSAVKEAQACPGHSVTFPIDKLVQDVDVPEENITTMLTYLELCQTRSWIKLKQPVNATCYIQCYGGTSHLTALAKQATTVLAAMKFYHNPEGASNELEFPYIELAAKMGWDAYIVRRELRDLPKRVIAGAKSAVHVEFKDLSFHVQAPGNLSDEERDEVTDYLHQRVCAQKNAEVRRLRELHQSLLNVASSTHYDAADEVDKEKDATLKNKINLYFSDSYENSASDWQTLAPQLPSAHILSSVQRDIRSFIQKYHDLSLRGRVIARIFQGIGSPNYPAMTWGRIRQYWRKHIDIDFDWLVRNATEEITASHLR